MLSLYEYARISKTLEKELALVNGWLKPHKLNEITGETAADKTNK